MADKSDFGRPVAIPSSRLSRLSRLGAMTAGVAGNAMARGAAELASGRRPQMRDLLLTPRNIRRITQDLARMRGAAMKLGQLLSMDTGDILSPELAQIMARLRAEADFMPPAQLRTVLMAEWGTDWLRRFKRFDVRPVAAASIGQVHRAQLKDGRDLAIKVQYPGVAASIDSDVANVAALVRMTGLIPNGFELEPFVEEARRQLHAETDYRAEGAHLARFSELLKDDRRYLVPDYHADLSSGSVLAMTYVPSSPLDAPSGLTKDTKNQIAADLVALFLRELFEFGVMQTDPNLANFRFCRDTNRLILLDFGATRSLAPEIVASYRRLIAAGLGADGPAMRAAATDLGILSDSIRPDHQAALIEMMDIAFAALRTESFDFADQSLITELNKRGMALAEGGFVPPPVPMDVLFLQRKLGGVALIATQLGADLPVREMLRAYV